jgi:hypothetical protein
VQKKQSMSWAIAKRCLRFRALSLTLIRHYFEPAKAMSPTASGNKTVARRPPRNPLGVMFRAVGACKQPVRSSARGFRSHRLRSLLSLESFVGLGLIALAIGFASFQAEAGEILARVQSRQLLRCGVSDGRLGFSYQDAKGRWSGLDVDFCRAVAAAVVGSAEKVKYFPLFQRGNFLRRILTPLWKRGRGDFRTE